MLAPPDSTPDPFAGLPRGHFRAIAADPPWSYKVRSPKGEGRSASQHYRTMPLSALTQLKVGALAAKDAHLFLWTPGNNLPNALFLLDWWGFRFSSVAFVWLKPTKDERPILDPRAFFCGMGKTTRKNAEFVLLGHRGSPKRLRKDIRELIIAPRREHSRKPDEFYERVQQYATGPYLDLFSRQRRDGWTSWGNEVDKFSAVA